MIQSLQLTNYRGFRNFELHDLGRVNLIVGTNNAGKTSVLEAVHILEGTGEFGPIWSTLTRRGEDVDDRESSNVKQVEIRRLFHGHEISIGSNLEIAATTGKERGLFTARIAEPSPEMKVRQPSLFDSSEGTDEPEFLSQAAALGIRWVKEPTGEDISVLLNLTPSGGLARNEVRFLNRTTDTYRSPIIFITAASLTADKVIDLFEEIVLTPYEEFVIEALRAIEPSIERIATKGTERRRFLSSRIDIRGGLIVKCRGIRDRIPIGSMGDGLWRILSLALALARAQDGTLLVDEIDTGLHYSVMENMWKLVSQTAKRLNVQVFATTHSRDCYESLAAISHESVSKHSEITIQRIERGKERSVAYSEQEIVAAARRHLEVR